MGVPFNLASPSFSDLLTVMIVSGIVTLLALIIVIDRMVERRRFARRFNRPHLDIQIGDRVRTTLGFEAEVVSVSDQVVDLKLDSGGVLNVFRGEIISRIPHESRGGCRS